MRIKLLLPLLLMGVILNAQSIKITGKIVENGSQKTLPGVGIIVSDAKDSTKRHLTATDINGVFVINGLQANSSYILKTSYLGYKEIMKSFETKNTAVLLGTLIVKPKSEVLDEVVVEGQKTPVVQKGDTTEMSAAAYKVNVDANAQDLVQKMPGITIENGTIKAHGEAVARVLLDGKNYFGDDAAMALQNLPAEVIDKVQIYNKMSDQAEFTGFDDGNSSKVLNIVTRADRRHGENGTVTVGSDFSDKYMASGRLSIFRGDKNLTLIGGANNINQQSFSTQDILGVMGGTGGRRGGSAYVGRQSGLNKPSSLGFNFSNTINKKLTISGSYFFNKQDNHTIQTSNVQDFIDTTLLPKYQYQTSNSANMNFNHRFDMRLEYMIDSANSIIWAPRFSTQTNNSNSNTAQLKYNLLPDTIQFVNSNNSSDGYGYNYTNDFTIRHKFSKRGRTISIGNTISGNLNGSKGLQYSLTQRIFKPDSIIDQRSDSKTSGTSVSTNLAYTEPIGTFSILQFSYNVSFSNNHTDKYAYDLATDSLNQKYSNVYQSSYNTQRGGIAYRIRSGAKMFAFAGIDYQVASLSAERTYPSTAKVDKPFNNFLPSGMLNYKFTKNSNLRVLYRASTSPPSVNQLQDVITISNLLNFSQGNPDLIPEYTHNGRFNYRYSNPDKFTNFGFNFFGNYTRNTIGNALSFVSRDSVINSGKVFDTIPKGGQLSKPQNFGDSWDSRIFINYGFLFMPIKCNLNFVGGAGYTKTPGSTNNMLSTNNQYNLTGGLVIASNISKNADFTLSYTGNYTISHVSYNGDITEIMSKINNTNSKIWNHSLSLTSVFTIWDRLLLQNTLNEQINSGLGSGYNQSYLIWNAGIGLKVFKNKAGQVKLSVFDLLNQNQNISRSVSSVSISDTRTNTLQRFLMFSFTYTLRNYQGNDGEEHHHDGFEHGHGGFGGGPGRGHDGGGF